MAYLIAGPLVALVGIVAVFFVMRRKSVEKRSMYSARRSQIEHKVRAARQRTLTPRGHSERPAEETTAAASAYAPTQAQQSVTYEAPAYEPPPAAAPAAPPARPEQAPAPPPWETTSAPQPASSFDYPAAPAQPAYTPPAPEPFRPAPEPTPMPAPSDQSWTPAPSPAAEPVATDEPVRNGTACRRKSAAALVEHEPCRHIAVHPRNLDRIRVTAERAHHLHGRTFQRDAADDRRDGHGAIAPETFAHQLEDRGDRDERVRRADDDAVRLVQRCRDLRTGPCISHPGECN